MAFILFVSLSNATTEGSFSTTPFPLMYTKMLAVPKSIPISVHCILYPFLHGFHSYSIRYSISVYLFIIFSNTFCTVNVKVTRTLL